ncbi:MAG: hypothetical protein J1F67_12575 [Muribaculaceae bacterium]|nr:hypothetical protein [Muribaculaceae bacterium]
MLCFGELKTLQNQDIKLMPDQLIETILKDIYDKIFILTDIVPCRVAYSSEPLEDGISE